MSNTDTILKRMQVVRAIADDGRCTHCKPHRGENYGAGGKPDMRFVNGKIKKNKDKDRK